MNSPRQSSRNTLVRVGLEHILIGGRGSRLAEVDKLICSVARPHEQESSSSDSAVVHANDANAEDGTNEGICGIATMLE